MKLRWKPLSIFAALALALASSGLTAAPVVIEAAPGGDKPLGKHLPHLERTLKLSGSRGETLNFTLRISGKPAPGSKLFADSTIGNFRFYQMSPIRTVHPSFPGAFVGEHFDPLIPLPDGILPDGATWIWGEFEIPKGTAPGTYPTTIKLPSGVSLPVEVKVWKMTIPESPALPGYSEYSTFYGLVGHYGKWAEGEGPLAQKYVAEMIRHRLAPLKSWITRPPVRSGEGATSTLDLGSPETPGTFASIYFKDFPHWPLVTIPPLDSKKSDIRPAAYWSAVEHTLQSSPLSGRGMVYLWDEPKPKDHAAIIAQADVIRKFAPDAKIMVTTPYTRDLDASVDIFVPLLRNFMPGGKFASETAYRELQKKGRQVWSYVSCTSHGCDGPEDEGTPDFVLDRPPSYIRSIAWIAHRYHLNGFLYYSVNNVYRLMPKQDPWESVWDFSGNGDGTLFYPGRPGLHGMTEQSPVASIRLKLWRETSFDAEYIRWIEARSPRWWPAAFKKVVQDAKHWSRNYDDFRELRERIGNELDSAPTASSISRSTSGAAP